ncbi:MAG: DUF2723 domain-containing protein [Candidatus Promineifilaceae bacterium]
MALGLFVGRISAELLRPGLLLASVLTLFAVGLAVVTLQRRTIRLTWPLLILLVYVFNPEPDPRIAALVGVAAVLTLTQIFARFGRLAPLSHRKASILTAMLLTLGAFLLYVNTLSPDLLPADAGELQLVAARWGVAHPTGYPLYSILANVATRLPLGPNPAFRANLLSATTSAATLLILYLAVYKLTSDRVAGLLAVVVLGASTTFWSQATTANVRSLTALFTAAAFYLLVVLREKRAGPDTGSGQLSRPPDDLDGKVDERSALWLQALFVLLLVLAVTHHSSLVFIGGLMALYAIFVRPSFIKEPNRWPVFFVATLIGLLPLLYLPIRGAAGAIGAPEDLDTFNGFVHHVLGLGFRGDLFYFDTLPVLWARLMVMVNVLTFQFPSFVLLIMLLGLVVLLRRDRGLAVLLAASIAVHTFVAAVYRAPQTVEYMLPAYVLLAASFGYAAGFLRGIGYRSIITGYRDQVVNVAAILLLTAMAMSIFAQLIQSYGSFRALSRLTVARDYAQPLLQDAPSDSVILADWHWATPLWYLQEVEGMRRDIQVQYVFPESGPYADTWARQIADQLAAGHPVVSTHFDVSTFSQLPVAEPFHQAFLFRQEPLWTLPDGYSEMTAEIGPGVFSRGIYLSSQEARPGQELLFELAWQSGSQTDPGRALYVHLIGPDGRLYAGDDQLARPASQGLTVNQFGLTPLLHTPPGSYELVIGSYGSPEAAPADAVTVAQIDVVAATEPPFTMNSVFRALAGAQDERTLIGYDWDSTLPGKQRLYLHWSVDGGYQTQIVDVDGGQYAMPAWFGPWGVEIAGSLFELDRSSAYIPFGQGLIWLGQSRDKARSFSPGERVRLSQEFTTSRPVLSDLIVSLRLVGYQEDGKSWAWWDLDDGVPAMGAIPTLKWIAGSRIHHPVYSTISPDARPEQQTEPLLLLYDAFTARQLPILDERITQLAPWIPLGKVPIVTES